MSLIEVKNPRIRVVGHHGETTPAQTQTVGFSFMGRGFVYDPDSMVLFVAGDADTESELANTNGPGKFSQRPNFKLPNCDKARTMVLVPSKSCNMKCRYCIMDNAEYPYPVSPELTVETAISAIRKNTFSNDNNTIGFFGGEPLLRFCFIREVVRWLKRSTEFRHYRYSITTNATLIDDSIADFLSEHEFGIIVSLDGPEKLHNRNRRLSNGGGTYDLTMRGIELLAKRENLRRRITLRATYISDGAHILERVKHLNEIAWRYGFANVSVEPAELSEGCNAGDISPYLDTPARLEQLEDEYEETAEWFAEKINNGENPKFHHFAMRMKRLSERTPAPSECGAGVGYLTVGPDGTLYACHRLGKSAIGDQHGIDRRRQAEWIDNRYYAREKCPDCWLRNVCGGGCRWTGKNSGGCRINNQFECWLTEVCVKSAAWILSETMNQ